MQRKLHVEALEDRLLTAIASPSAVLNAPRPADRPVAVTVPLKVVNVLGLAGSGSATPTYINPYVVGIMGFSLQHNQTLVRVRGRKGKSR